MDSPISVVCDPPPRDDYDSAEIEAAIDCRDAVITHRTAQLKGLQRAVRVREKATAAAKAAEIGQ